jgi:hypothetical protein
MKIETQRAIVTVVIALLVAVLACNAPENAQVPTTESQADAGTKTGSEESTQSPTVESTVAATDTPSPTVCNPNGKFVKDVTIPDGTEFNPGATFVKVWRMRNTGNCPWEAGTKLVFSSGDQMDGPAEVTVTTPVAPNTEVDISVDLKAPDTPGTYQGKWQLRDSGGTFFGGAVWVKIVVPEQVTDTPKPTEEPTQEPTVEATSDGCEDVDPELQPILDTAESKGYDLGCPTSEAFLVEKNGDTGAFQEYWANVTDTNPHTHYRSLMIWRADTQEIYVIVGEDTDASKGTIMAYTDTWQEGQPEIHPSCAGMTPPTGYQMPIRGFGKVWCYNDLEDDIGWPDQAEVQVDLYVQPTQNGLLIQVTGSNVGYLIAMDYRAVRAVTQFISP